MSTEATKPPWTRIQWNSGLRQADLHGQCLTGDWQETLHEEVEALKEEIQPYDKTELWDLAKRITNPYELINTFSNRLKLPPSVCCLKPLSRSYFKMIEILHHLNFFNRHKNPKLKTLHICEGPGGFMEAFTSMAEQQKRKIQACYGMTLKSTHQMIPGWRRATQFLQRNPHIHLLYGPTRTGDIYEPANQTACREAVGLGAHLVTADGGFDFSDDFHAQEKSMFRLLVCSALILIECVAYEGDVVLKFFDCNSRTTRDLLAILASCFQYWALYKPVTSRPCNSEWYFIGKSAYLHREGAIELLKQLRDGLAVPDAQPYTRLLESNPIEDTLNQLQAERIQKQTEALQHVLTFCRTKDSVSQEVLWAKQRPNSLSWCYAFRVPTNG